MKYGILVFVVFVWVSNSLAQFTGDPELLRLVAVQNRANREAILTWYGVAEVTTRLVDEGDAWDVTRFARVEFAYDRAAGKYMYMQTQTRETGRKGKEPPDENDSVVWGAIRTPDGFHRTIMDPENWTTS